MTSSTSPWWSLEAEEVSVPTSVGLSPSEPQATSATSEQAPMNPVIVFFIPQGCQRATGARTDRRRPSAPIARASCRIRAPRPPDCGIGTVCPVREPMLR